MLVNLKNKKSKNFSNQQLRTKQKKTQFIVLLN